jgi:hypothetical protein
MQAMLLVGVWVKNCSKALSPPAEAPMVTTGKLSRSGVVTEGAGAKLEDARGTMVLLAFFLLVALRLVFALAIFFLFIAFLLARS